MKKGKRKWGVWLCNKTDRQDDEWAFVMASSSKDAKANVEYDSYRFYLGEASPVMKFRRDNGLPRNIK